MGYGGQSFLVVLLPLGSLDETSYQPKFFWICSAGSGATARFVILG